MSELSRVDVDFEHDSEVETHREVVVLDAADGDAVVIVVGSAGEDLMPIHG